MASDTIGKLFERFIDAALCSEGLQQPVVVLVDHPGVRAARQVRVRRFSFASGLAPLEPRRGLGLAEFRSDKLPQSFVLRLIRGQRLLQRLDDELLPTP